MTGWICGGGVRLDGLMGADLAYIQLLLNDDAKPRFIHEVCQHRNQSRNDAHGKVRHWYLAATPGRAPERSCSIVIESPVLESAHASVEALTAAVSRRIVQQLQGALSAGRDASMVVSGGRTPVALFQLLATVPLDWSRVWITLADERWVAPDSEHSNEALVRTHLLQHQARSAHFIGLKNAAPTASEGAARSWAALSALPRPFDVVVLGLGEDGHFASLFPGSPGLEEALDAAQPPGCTGMTAPVPPQQRISLNFAALLDARLLLLPISGERKWQVYQQAQEPGATTTLPVRALLRQRTATLEVHHFP
jgi:6-phosphogluconolactonase